jgi:catechol 2,3-dioxygenase-like lactoylglutathione lyase family enzyme
MKRTTKLKCLTSTELIDEPLTWTTKGYRRALHWVLKIGSLEANLKFFSKCFGMQVYRHEEFETGCEATCNGPYGGAWSKTMIGIGENERNSFALELTHNYGIHLSVLLSSSNFIGKILGISDYQRGNDMRYIAINEDAFIGPETLLQVTSDGRKFLESPDGYWFLLLPNNKDNWAQNTFKYVSLNVKSLHDSLAFYQNVLDASVLKPSKFVESMNSALIYFNNSSDVKLELVEVEGNSEIFRGNSYIIIYVITILFQ